MIEPQSRPLAELTIKVRELAGKQFNISGALREVNLARRTCHIYLPGGKFVTCTFSPALEPEVKAALGQEVEVV